MSSIPWKSNLRSLIIHFVANLASPPFVFLSRINSWETGVCGEKEDDKANSMNAKNLIFRTGLI